MAHVNGCVEVLQRLLHHHLTRIVLSVLLVLGGLRNVNAAVVDPKIDTYVYKNGINPRGIVADAMGNVYFADNTNNAVKKIPYGTDHPSALLPQSYYFLELN